MFNDRYMLTDLVLSGQKTQTRRIIKPQDERLGYLRGWNLDWGFAEFGREGETPLMLCPKYYVGEMVAVAMSYKSIYKRVAKNWEYAEDYKREHENLAGWNNKMFTNTKMPFAQIKITNIRVERLQDISDEDCMREGIRDYEDYVFFENFSSRGYNNVCYYSFLRDAFADLINRINGKGAWESNPYVWAYDFELAK